MSSYLNRFREKMSREGLSEIVVSAFEYFYNRLVSGESGYLSKDMIHQPPAEKIVKYQDLQTGDTASLEKLAVIKLNGGLGTSMGLEKAKSLLKIKNGLTFLDITARQILHYRKKLKKGIPLIFMNSFNTSRDTLEFLSKYPDLELPGIPLEFLQNKFPKVKADDLSPFEDDNEKITWNPPGHGEIYMVLKQSGILDILLQRGYRYVFISNSDNLGAVVDERILNYMSGQNIPFVMEVCYRTDMDRKGGHLAGDLRGNLLLRESAQCPSDEINEFQDIDHYRYFNTNNLWVDLQALKQKLEENNDFLKLTPIMNRKQINGTKVFQLESAMGAAINVFRKSRAVVVERNRFIPVKKSNDFLSVLSDAYELTDSWQLQLSSGRRKAPQIDLDERYYKNVGDFKERFIGGYPSLRDCESLDIKGNLYFDGPVTVKGRVKIKAEGTRRLKDVTFDDAQYIL